MKKKKKGQMLYKHQLLYLNLTTTTACIYIYIYFILVTVYITRSWLSVDESISINRASCFLLILFLLFDITPPLEENVATFMEMVPLYL